MLLRLTFDPENVQRLGFVKRCRAFNLASRSATPFLPKYGPFLDHVKAKSAHVCAFYVDTENFLSLFYVFRFSRAVLDEKATRGSSFKSA